MVYGGGGMGKSSRAAEAAAYIYKTLGLKTRVVNADGGGTESAFLPLISEGIASIWHIDQWEERSLFSMLDMATKGWWPVDVATPGCPLMPPLSVWRPCPFCGKDSGAKGLGSASECASCKEKFHAGQVLPFQRDRINGMEKVGLVVFEGFTRFGEMLLNRLKVSDPTGGNTILEGSKDDSFKVSSPGQAHYLMAQSYMGQFVANSRKIPTPLVMWTALELRADDDGKPLYGPKGPGKALTSLCIPWFTDVLHLDGVPKRVNGAIAKDPNGIEILERKLYLAPHFPPDNPQYRFAAKTSAPNGGDMPLSIEPDMKLFFSELAKAYDKAGKKLLS